jgi:hypothetical protein
MDAIKEKSHRDRVHYAACNHLGCLDKFQTITRPADAEMQEAIRSNQPEPAASTQLPENQTESSIQAYPTYPSIDLTRPLPPIRRRQFTAFPFKHSHVKNKPN